MTYHLVTHLLERGLHVHVVTGRSDLPPHPNLTVKQILSPERPASIQYALFGLLASIHIATRRDDVVHAAGALVLNRCDVITVHFCHHYFQDVIQISRRRRSSLPFLLNETAFNVLARLAEKWCYGPRTPQRLVAISSGGRRELERYFPRRVSSMQTIPNGVDIQLFHPNTRVRESVRARLAVPNDACVAVFVGGDWHRKGLDIAIAALPLAPEWRLIVVGEGPQSSAEELAGRLGCSERVTFVGLQKRPERFLQAADAFVLPTAYETFPLAALEAAACGLPLAVTAANGIDEFVKHDVNGLVIERTPESVAQALRRLGADAALRRTMGEAARATVSRMGWSSIADRYIAVYHELADRQRDAPRPPRG